MAKDGKNIPNEGTPSEATLKNALAAMQEKKKLRIENENKNKNNKTLIEAKTAAAKKEMTEDPHAAIKDKINQAAELLKEAFPDLGITVEYVPPPSPNELSSYAIRFDLTSNNMPSNVRAQYASVLSAEFKELFNSVTPINRGQDNKSLSVQFNYDKLDGSLVLNDTSNKNVDNILAKTSQSFRDDFNQALRVKQDALVAKPKNEPKVNIKANKDNIVDDLRKAITDPEYFEQNRKNLNNKKINWQKTESEDKTIVVQNAVEELMQQAKKDAKINLKNKEDFLVTVKNIKFELTSKYQFKAGELDTLIDIIFEKVKEKEKIQLQQSLDPASAEKTKEIESFSHDIEALKKNLDNIQPLHAGASAQEKRQHKQNKENLESQIRDLEFRKKNAQRRLDATKAEVLSTENNNSSDEELTMAHPIEIQTELKPTINDTSLEEKDDLNEELDPIAEIKARLLDAEKRLETAQKTFDKFKPNTAAAKKAKQQLDSAKSIVEGLKADLAEATKKLEAESIHTIDKDETLIGESDYLAESTELDIPNKQSLLNLTALEWEEAEKFFEANPHEVKFSKKIEGRDSEFNHSFIKVQDELFAIANRKIAGEEKAGLLGEGSYGKVKMVQAKDGSNFAVKIEGRGARGEEDTENKVMKLIDYVKGEVERDLGHGKDFKDQFTTKKLYTITKLRDGVELFEALYFDASVNPRKNLTIEQKLYAGLGSAKTVNNLHLLGIIHRDLKPENIMMDINGNQIIIESIDYGHSMILPQGQTSLETGIVVGTPGYIAPESYNGIYSFATDIYQLGVMFQQDLGLSNDIQLKNLIDRMLDDNPNNRPEMDEIISTLDNAIIRREQVNHLINVQLNAEDVTRFYVGSDNELAEHELDAIQFLLQEHGYENAILVDETEADAFYITPEAKLFLQDYLAEQQNYVFDNELGQPEELPAENADFLYTEAERLEAIKDLIDNQLVYRDNFEFSVGDSGLSEKNLDIIINLLQEQGFVDPIHEDQGTFDISVEAKDYLENQLFLANEQELEQIAEKSAENDAPLYTDEERIEAIKELINDQLVFSSNLEFSVGEFGLSAKNLDVILEFLNQQGFHEPIFYNDGIYEITDEAKAHLEDVLNFAKEQELDNEHELVEKPEETTTNKINDDAMVLALKAKNINGYSLLAAAIKAGNINYLNKVIESYKTYYPEGLQEHLSLTTTDHNLNPLQIALLTKNVEMLRVVSDLYLEVDNTDNLYLDAVEAKSADGQNIFMLAAAGKNGEIIDKLKADLVYNPQIVQALLLEATEEGHNALLLSAGLGSSKTFSAMNELYIDYAPDELEKYFFSKNKKNMSLIKAASYSTDENMLKTVLEAAYQYDAEKCKEQIKFIIEHDQALWKKIEDKGALNDELADYALESILELKTAQYNEDYQEAVKNFEYTEEEKINTEPEEQVEQEASEKLTDVDDVTHKQKTMPATVEPENVKPQAPESKSEAVKLRNNRKALSKSMSFLPSFDGDKTSSLETKNLVKPQKNQAAKLRETSEIESTNLTDLSLIAKTKPNEHKPQSKHLNKKPQSKSHMPHYDKKRALSPEDMAEKLYLKFQQKLKNKVFVEEDWKYKQKDEKITIASRNSESPRKISIEPVSNGMRFSGSNGAESDIAKAAYTYEKVNSKAGKEVNFEVSAKNSKEASKFMKKLSEGGFDINKITVINLPDQKLEGAELTKLKDNIKVKSTKFNEI